MDGKHQACQLNYNVCKSPKQAILIMNQVAKDFHDGKIKKEERGLYIARDRILAEEWRGVKTLEHPRALP